MKTDFGAANGCFCLLLFHIVTWCFHLSRFFPSLNIVTWFFHVRGYFFRSLKRLTSIYGGSFIFWTRTNSYYLIFQICLYKKCLNSQIAVVMIKLLQSFHGNYSKISLFISANTNERFIVSENYYIAHHDAKMCFLPMRRCHILLLEGTEESLQRLDRFFFTHQQVNCLNTFFKCLFRRKIVALSGQVFANV